MAYTLLLNRFQLSRRNGWVNDFGEVFIIFPRKELHICDKNRRIRAPGNPAKVICKQKMKVNLLLKRRRWQGITVYLEGEIGSPEDVSAVIANDGPGILLQMLGEDSEPQGSVEHMIFLDTNVGTDFVGFWK